jgi:hypothetical protein
MALPKGTSKETKKAILSMYSLQKNVYNSLKLLAENAGLMKLSNVRIVLRTLDGFSNNAGRTYMKLLLADSLYLFIIGIKSVDSFGSDIYKYQSIDYMYYEKKQSKYVISNL